MKEELHRYLTELAPDTKARITSHFAAEVEEFSILIGSMTATLQRYLEHRRINNIHDPSDPKHVALGLMTKSANSITAGFELALGGYMWEPPILLRSAMEGCAVAWDIVHNQDRFITWTSGKRFDATDSISRVKEAVGGAGRLYGFMSNMHVHTNPINSTPSILKSDLGHTFQQFGLTPAGMESIRKSEIYYSLIVSHICLKLTELIFYRYSSELETIERIPGTNNMRNKVSNRHQRFVDIALEHFGSEAKGEAT